MNTKVLLIDDDPLNLTLVKSQLKAHGFEVHTASDGGEGLRLAHELVPDLVIVDVVMPKVDGWTFVKMMATSPIVKSIPIVVLTGKERMKEQFEKEGVH